MCLRIGYIHVYVYRSLRLFVYARKYGLQMVSWTIKKANNKDDHDALPMRSSSSSSSLFRKWCVLKNNLKRKSKTPGRFYDGDGIGKRFYKFQKIRLNRSVLNVDKDDFSTENAIIRQENTDNMNVVEYDYNNDGGSINNNNNSNNSNNNNYNNSSWINACRYVYLDCYYYSKENWFRSIIMLIVITVISNYFVQNLIKLFEQLRITIVSFYKWKILSSFIIPYSNDNNSNSNIISGSGVSGVSNIVMNIISWINFIKNIFSLA